MTISFLWGQIHVSIARKRGKPPSQVSLRNWMSAQWSSRWCQKNMTWSCDRKVTIYDDIYYPWFHNNGTLKETMLVKSSIEWHYNNTQPDSVFHDLTNPPLQPCLTANNPQRRCFLILRCRLFLSLWSRIHQVLVVPSANSKKLFLCCYNKLHSHWG